MERWICPVIFIVIIVAGCATVGPVEEKLSEINYEDGISKEEAKAIAINYIDKNGIKIYRHIGTRDSGTMWKVRFFRSSWSLKVFIVAVDKKTGWVIYAE